MDYCSVKSHPAMEQENAALRAEVEHRRAQYEHMEKDLHNANLQIREVWGLLDSQPSGPGEGMVSEGGEAMAQLEWADKYRALKAKHGFIEKLKCGINKPMGIGETCTLEVGHRGACDYTKNLIEPSPKEEHRRCQRCNVELSKTLYWLHPNDCEQKMIRSKETLCDKEYPFGEGNYSYCGRILGHEGSCGRG